MKPCIRCGDTKPLDEFYVHPQMGDGHLNKCKECCRAYARRRHHQKMQDHGWREAERERSRRKVARASWGSTDPHKRAARTALGNAVRRGDVIPAEHCEDCGHDFSEFRREGHHEDYSKPLVVVWLCALCHGRRHRSAA